MVNYAYKSTGALASVGTDLIGTNPAANNNVISHLWYNGFGATRQINYGNNRRLRLWYSAHRHQMTQMAVDNQNGTDPIISKAYAYSVESGGADNDGRIKRITDYIDSNYSVTYGYDEYNRLRSATAPAYNRSYTYDPWGNLTQVYVSNGVLTTYNIPNNANGAPATNRMSSVSYSSGGSTAYTWDAAGNMTGEGATSFQYDAASRLKTVNNGTTETNGFDGDSQRVKKVEGSVTVFYVRSSVMGKALMEVGGNGAMYRAYVYGKNTLVAQLAPDGQFYWRHENHLGGGYKLTNSAGTVVYRAEHDPHGNVLLETGSTTLTANKFTSYERDNSTGLDYANARMYSGSRGRFTKPDPAGLSAADVRPQSLNQYTYTDNDPVNMIDPSGNDAYYYECRNYRYWYDGWREFEVCELRGSPRQAEPGESGSGGGGGRGGTGTSPMESAQSRIERERRRKEDEGISEADRKLQVKSVFGNSVCCF
jgi:RHS repeat-associated protein